MIMCELSGTRLRKSITSCLPPLHLDLTLTWVSVTEFPKFVIGCRRLEKTTCTLMVATRTAVGLHTSQDVTQRTRANPITTDLSTLTKGAGTLRIPWMIPQTPGLANDLREAHLALPVGGWTIETCRTRSLSVARPALLVFHLRGNLARLPRAGLIPHPHPLFVPPESDQNLRPDLPSVLDRLFGLLLILVPILPNLLYEYLFSEVTQLANSVVEVVVVNDLACVFRRMVFGTPLRPLLLPLQCIRVQMNRGLRIALPFILLSPNDLLRRILLQGLVDNPVYLNVDFSALCRVDITISKLMEVNFVVLPESCWSLTNSAGSSINPDATPQGNQLGKPKRKRRGVNRKKRSNQAASVGDIDDPNTSPSPSDDVGSVASHIPSPVDEVKAPEDLFFPVLPEPQAAASATKEEIPFLTPSGPEIKPPLAAETAAENEVLPSTALLSEGLSYRKSEAPTHVMADTSSPGATCKQSFLQDGNKDTSPVIEVTTELPRLVIPPSDTPIKPPPARNGLHEVTKADSPSQSPSALFPPVPVGNTNLPPSEPSLGQCSPPRFLPINGPQEAITSSPVSSTAPTPSLQTPSPPYVDPVVVVAAPTVQEPEDDLMPASPVSSVLHAVGVPTIVRPDRDTFSANAKEAESLTEALHMVVSARQQLDVQTREERVNPILMSNRAMAPPLSVVPTPPADTLVQEVLASQPVENTIQAFESHVRNSLVANMASRQKTVDEKIVQLRREYLALHKEWVTRCVELDNSHRVDPATGDVAAVPTRTTRRSAAVLGDAVRSDLEMEQIIASLGNDELYDPAHLALRNLAVIPDMISVSRGKVDAVFDDTNNTVDDPQSFFDPSPGLAEWTDDEVEIYKQRFAKYPKQFGQIAVGLKHKTQAQCVQFYYLHKKALIDFREAITTYGQSKRRRGGRRTDKKKGGLLADIRQHDAEVSKGQDSVKRRPGAVGRRRRESARTVQRRSSTAVQQEEQTPVTTPTPEPEPEPVRPKRRRNPRAAPEPEPVSAGIRTGTEEPPPKRSRRGPRKPKIVPVPETSTPEPKSLSKPAIEVPSPSIEEIG
jgi:hypothetical protein